jgi:transposase InsO family protein
MIVPDWILYAWFNNERLHTSLGGIPPAEYEQPHARRQVAKRALDEK